MKKPILISYLVLVLILIGLLVSLELQQQKLSNSNLKHSEVPKEVYRLLSVTDLPAKCNNIYREAVKDEILTTGEYQEIYTCVMDIRKKRIEYMEKNYPMKKR